MINIAIFPIPSCVTFPGAVFPLHVFEPRYRKMIHHCLTENMPLGITHTQKVLSEAKSSGSLDVNLATYKPYNIFSAGVCELIETLEDGRLFCQVKLGARYQMIAEQQKLPFIIYRCETYEDAPTDTQALEELDLLKEKITKRLLAITSQQPGLQALLTSSEWQAKPAKDLSFELFNIIRFDPDTQQKILEMNSPVNRMESLLSLLN